MRIGRDRRQFIVGAGALALGCPAVVRAQQASGEPYKIGVTYPLSGPQGAWGQLIVPAIEIVDARIKDTRKIYDTISDNGAGAGLTLGGRPVRPLDVDLRWVGGMMLKNGEVEETGLAAGVLGHPAMGVAWLANKLGQHDVALEPGHIVLAGSFTRVVFARKGDTLHADFGQLGGLSIQFI